MLARLRKSLAAVKRVTRAIPSVFQLASLVCLTVSGFVLAPFVGWLVLGLCLGVIGWAIDRDDD